MSAIGNLKASQLTIWLLVLLALYLLYERGRVNKIQELEDTALIQIEEQDEVNDYVIESLDELRNRVDGVSTEINKETQIQKVKHEAKIKAIGVRSYSLDESANTIYSGMSKQYEFDKADSSKVRN